MSEEKQRNLNGKEHGCDDKFGNSEVSHNASQTSDHKQHDDSIKGAEISPNGVVIEELSDENLHECSSEDPEYEVIYEFPDDSENENGDHLSEAGATSFQKISQASDQNKHRSFLEISENQNDEISVVVDNKTLDKDSSDDDDDIAGTSGEAGRKRKKCPTSSIQNKRHKDVPSLFNPLIQIPPESEDIAQVKGAGDESTSDEFADVEDNLKDSSSSEDFINESANETPLKDLASDIDHRKESENKSLDEQRMTDMTSASSSSDSYNSKCVENTAKNIIFPSTLKGETKPAIKLSDESKKKFELSMPTILEVRESESDEQIPRTVISKTNPLKMKTSMVKRKDRCHVCCVKLGLCAIQCRCGGYYCAKHRYDKEHNCTFDYRSMAAQEIQKNNPRIVAEKVRKL